MATKTPVRVAITGAAGQIGYSLVYRVANGDLLGPDQPLILQLLEITPALGALQGVVMELEDCAFPLLHDIVPTDDAGTAFMDVNVALLVGSRPRTKGMERKDLLEANGAIFTVQGRALAEHAAADAAVDHVHTWVTGTPKGDWVSMAIPSDGSYGVPEGLISSFPVTTEKGKISIVQGLEIDEFSRARIDKSVNELSEERDAVRE